MQGGAYMRWVFLIIALFIFQSSHAVQLKTTWGFSWDAYPTPEAISYFILQIDSDSEILATYKIDGGTSTKISNVIVPSDVTGTITAVIRACNLAGMCSANSNRVTLDRTAPDAPGFIQHFGNR